MKKTLDQNITKQQTLEVTKGQVIIHCRFKNNSFGSSIGIRPNILLYCSLTQHKSQLVFAEGIKLRPRFTYVSKGGVLTFTLVFEGLPEASVCFDLVEPKVLGFTPWVVKSIPRNKADVYNIRV